MYTKKFKKDDSKFIFQYNKTYISRLELIEPLIINKIKTDKRYKDMNLIDTIQNINEKGNFYESNTDSNKDKNKETTLNKRENDDKSKLYQNKTKIIIGILFLVSDQKESVFDEIKSTKESKIIKSKDSYYSKNSKYYIEDLKGRIEVSLESNNLDELVLSTGMVLGFIGDFDDKGKFITENIIFPGPITANSKLKKCGIEKIAFLSKFKANINNNYEKFKVLSDYLNNIFTDTDKDKNRVLNKPFIDHLFIFGNMFSDLDIKDLPNEIVKFNKVVGNSGLKVTLVPSLNDPTTKSFPLEKFHQKIFKGSNSVNNPCVYNLNGKNFLLSGGENIKDIIKYKRKELGETKFVDINNTENQKRISEEYFSAMKAVIDSCYISPTSPDTLKSTPYDKNTDPFYIGNVFIDYFAVPGPGFDIKKLENGTLLVIVPDFNEENEVITIDTVNDDYEIIQYK